MSDAPSFAELDDQHGELLPPRTVMSLFITNGGAAGTPGTGGQGEPGSGDNSRNFSIGYQFNMQEQGIDGRDGSANPGR